MRLLNAAGETVADLNTQAVRIGRGKECQVSFRDDPRCSRLQAVIEKTSHGDIVIEVRARVMGCVSRGVIDVTWFL